MLRISPDAWQKIYDAVHFNPDLEVGGFGRITVIPGLKAEDTELYCDEILIPPQVVNAVHTDVTVEALDWLQVERLRAGDIGQFWLWWHSHNWMPTNPSGTDTTTLARAARDAWNGKALGLVVNLRGDTHCWLNYTNPILGQLDSVKLPVEIDVNFDPAIRAAVHAAMRERVTVEQPKPKKDTVADVIEAAKRRNGGKWKGDQEHDDWPSFDEWKAIDEMANTLGIASLTDSEWAILEAGERKFAPIATVL